MPIYRLESFYLQNSVELEIGPYLLEGDIVELKSALLIISPKQEQASCETKTSKDYEMLGLVKKKIHFKTRPKPKPTPNIT